MRIIALNHHRSDNRIDKDRSDSGWSSSYLKHLLKILSFSTFPWLQNCTKYLMFSRPPSSSRQVQEETKMHSTNLHSQRKLFPRVTPAAVASSTSS